MPRNLNPKSRNNLIRKDRGLSELLQIRVSKPMVARLKSVDRDTIRGWIQAGLNQQSNDDTIALALADRIRCGVFDGLPELAELVDRVGVDEAISIVTTIVRVDAPSPDGLNRALALVAAQRLLTSGDIAP
jgi:hypothetical protein